jgi:hypothetical protein
MAKHEFIHLANLITTLFPSETSGTYYTPSYRGQVPIGKLFSCYSNLRNSLASVGMIARETRKSNPVLNVKEEQLSDSEEIDKLGIVKSTNFDNVDIFFDAWKISIKKRELLLAKSTSTSEYLASFPYLKEPLGYKLVGNNI